MFQFTIIVVVSLAIYTGAEPLRQRSFASRSALARQEVQPTAEPRGYAPAGFTPEVPFELPTETRKPSTVYGPPLTSDTQTTQTDPLNDQTLSSAAQQPSTVYGPPLDSSDSEQPSTIYGPPLGSSESQQTPATVYGPPLGSSESQQTPATVYGPPLGSSESQQPATVYGPPTRTVQTDSEIAEDTFEILTADTEPENLDSDNEEVLVNEDGSLIAVSSTFDQDNVDERPARLVYQRFPQGRKRTTAVPERLVQARVLKPVNFFYTTRF